jgi:hypothetical protein
VRTRADTLAVWVWWCLRCWFEDSYWTYLFLGLVAVACVYCLIVYCIALYKYRSRAYELGTTRHDTRRSTQRGVRAQRSGSAG